jgi:hypothetical protein
MQAAKLTVKLDGDIIMGDYIRDKRYQSEGMGSIEDIRYFIPNSKICCTSNLAPAAVNPSFRKRPDQVLFIHMYSQRGKES